jgi:hypothetical protein
MSERESMLRAAVMTYFPMFIAALSLIASMYNNHLNSKALDVIQRSLGRGEYLRTCRDIIEAYFQVKFRVGLLVQDANHAGGIPSSTRAEAENAVNKFAALGTYLANLGDERAREQLHAPVMGARENRTRSRARSRFWCRKAVRASRPDVRRTQCRLHKNGSGISYPVQPPRRAVTGLVH